MTASALWRFAVPALVGLAGAVLLVAHSLYPGLPTPDETGGWSEWADQGHYLAASRAWAGLDLASPAHWYPPGYPLLAAFLLPLTPHDRFLLPDLACLIASQLACAALARRFFPTLRHAGALGALAFLVAGLGTLPGLKSWLVPWTTTPATALALLALLAALRLADRPEPGRAALTGALIGGIVWFRPADALPVALAAALALLPVLPGLTFRRALTVAAAALLGGAATVAGAIGVIQATTGFGSGSYVELSRQIGFEWRLLPLRFVTLVIDARPVFDGVGAERAEAGLHRGLGEVFVWMLPGLACCLPACLVRGAGRARAPLALWAIAQLCLALSYRDLHVLGLWQYGNFHYFKAIQPVLLLFALAPALDRTWRWPSLSAALAGLILLAGWRVTLEAADAAAPTAPADGRHAALGDLSSLRDIPVVAGHGVWSALTFDRSRLVIGESNFVSGFDFKIYPRREDLLIVPIRSLPPGPAVLEPAPGVILDGATPVRRMRQSFSFGLPCAFNLAGSAICGVLGAPVMPSASAGQPDAAE